MVSEIEIILVILLIVFAIFGPVVGYILRARIFNNSLLIAEKAADQHVKLAESRAKELLKEAKEKKRAI